MTALKEDKHEGTLQTASVCVGVCKIASWRAVSFFTKRLVDTLDFNGYERLYNWICNYLAPGGMQNNIHGE